MITNNNFCSICLDEILLKDEIIMLKCCHIYHYTCFLDYIYYNLRVIKQTKLIKCPLCRINTEKYYIMYYLVKRYDLAIKNIKSMEIKKNHLKNNLLVLNLKKCFIFKKNNKIKKILKKEEDLMEKIEHFNHIIITESKKVYKLRKIYYNLREINN